MAYNTLPQQPLANLKADYHNGVMVCFYLPPLLARRLALLTVAGGEPPQELHLTLDYLRPDYDLPLTGPTDKELRQAVRVVQMANLIGANQ